MKKIVKTLIFFIGDTVILFFTKVPIINFLFINILKYMARFGKGTSFLAQNGVMVYPIHFYYPVPDILKLKDSNIFDRISPMSGIDFNEMGQLQYLKTISLDYAKECNFPASKTSVETQYFTENGMFSYGCAAFLHTIIRNHKPAKFIEVGSGNSSKVINKALDLNKLEGKIGEYIVIDPFPIHYIKDLSNLSKLVAKPVEEVDMSLFYELEENDILFIDSSHQVKIGNDVVFLYLEVLPILKPGVIVHIHDIGLPKEYPKAYFLNEAFRVSWNEQYLLQAFLINNSKYRVLLGAANIMSKFNNEFKEAFPLYNPSYHLNSSGSFWMQRTTEGK
jgi:hypothetical protein